MRKIAAVVVMVGLAGAAWAAADGKALYGAKCASCHGKDAKGNPAMAKMFKVEPAALDLSSGWTAESEKIRATSLEKGKGKMPAFGEKMSAEERAAVVAYLKGGQEAAPTKTEAAPAAKPAAAGDGAGVYAKSCGSCHGKDGKGNPGMAKMFKVEPAVLDMTAAATAGKSVADLAAVTRDGRGKMPAYKGKLSDGEISAVAAYLKGGLKAAASESERP